MIDLPGQSAKFSVWARAWTGDLTAALLDAAGRGDTEWPELRPGSSGGSVSVGGSVSLDGWPLPTKFRGELGTLTITLNSGVTIAYPVRVMRETFKKNDKEQGLWDVTLVCQLVADPTAAGFAGSQPTAATETFSDKVLWAGLSTLVDPQGLVAESTRRLIVWGVSDSDAAEKTKIDAVLAAVATPYSGMKVRGGTFTRASKNAAYVDVAFGLTDTAEDVINPATATTTDASHLASEATAAAINATPATPTDDSFVVRTTTTRELNDAKTLTTRAYGLRTTEEDVTMPGTVKGNEVSDLDDQATVTLVNGSGTPPATPAAPVGLLVETESEQLNQLKWRHTFKYANLTAAQRLAFPAAPREDDPSDLSDEESVSSITTSATAPATPTPDNTALKLRRRRSVRVGGTPEQWQHTFGFARRNTKDDVEMDGTSSTDDVTDLESSAQITLVQTSSTPPAVPAAPTADTVHVATIAKQLHDTKWAFTFRYADRTSQQAIEYDQSPLEDDPTDLQDETTITLVQASATPTPPSTPSGLKLTGTRTRRRTATLWVHTFGYGRRDNKDAIEQEGTYTNTDPQVLSSSGRQTTVYTTASGVPADPTPPSGLQIVDSRITVLNNVKSKKEWSFERSTSKQKVEFGHYRSETDANVLISDHHEAAVWDSTGSAPSTPSAPSGLKLVSYIDLTLDPSRKCRVWHYGPNNSSDEVLNGHTTATYTQGFGRRYTNASIVSSALDVDTIAQSFFDQSDADQLAVEVKRLTPDKALLLITVQNTPVIVRFAFPAVPRTVYAKVDFADSSKVKVFVAEKVRLTTTTRYQVLITPQTVTEVQGVIRVRKFTSGSTIPIYTNGSNGGQRTFRTNASACLGLAAETVTYMGPSDGTVNTALSAPRVSEIEYALLHDPLGFVDTSELLMGWHFIPQDLSGVTVPGWVDVDDLGLTASKLSTADFSVFE